MIVQKRILIYLLIFFSSIYITHWVQEKRNNGLFIVGEEVGVDIRVWEMPVQRWSKYIIDNIKIRVECDLSEISCQRINEVEVGDKITFFGIVKRRMIKGKEVEKELINTQVLRIQKAKESKLWFMFGYMRWMYQFREKIEDKYRTYISSPYNNLLAGIVLGSKTQIQNNFYNALIATGTLHVIAASGFNIAIVAKVIISMFVQIFKRKTAILLSIIGVISYTLLAGASPAVVRAALMGGLAFTAEYLGREYWAKWSLVISAWLMLLVKPSLISDVSFQLSVAATAGILWGGEKIGTLLDRLLSFILGDLLEKKSGFIKDLILVDLSTTLAATLATMPVTLIHFEQISIISPLVNVLVLWLVPPIMALGALVAVFGWVSFLGSFLSWLVWPLLYIFVRVVMLFGSLPLANVQVLNVNWKMGCGWWVLLVSWWMRRSEEVS